MGAIQPLVMPKLGLTMTEGALAEWRVVPGAAFAAGDVLFVVETDKIANEVEAEAAGRMVEIVVGAGRTVEVGAVLAMVDLGDAAVPGDAAAPKASLPGPSATVSIQAPRSKPLPPAATGIGDVGKTGDRRIATPLARRIAREAGIDLAAVAGTGPRGRIKAVDVAGAVDTIHAATPPETVSAPAERAGAPDAKPVELSRIQRIASRRTVRSKSEIPHFYLTANVATDALADLRAEVNAAGPWPKTTLTHWMTAAIGRALVDVPSARRVWRGDGAVELAGSAVGVVADVRGDLFIPVVADAGTLSVGEVAAALSALVESAGTGSLRRQEMEGAAVSLSNLGMYGIDSVTPVIDLDQGMILGAGRAAGVYRPGPEGAPLLRNEVTLTLACDHRIHNGVSAALFLGRVVAYIERPMRLLLAPVAS